MSENEFTQLVKSMRISQTEYFKSRSFAALNKSRALEREVDKAIESIENPTLGL